MGDDPEWNKPFYFPKQLSMKFAMGYQVTRMHTKFIHGVTICNMVCEKCISKLLQIRIVRSLRKAHKWLSDSPEWQTKTDKSATEVRESSQ